MSESAAKSEYIEPLSEDYRADRLQFIGMVLTGLAIVTVILGIVAAIWFAVDRDRQKEVRLNQQVQETARECINRGNIWVNGNSCVVIPAPR